MRQIVRKIVPTLAVMALLCAGRPAGAVPFDAEILLGRAAAFFELAGRTLDRLGFIWAAEGGVWDPGGRPVPPSSGTTPPDAPPPAN